MKFYSIWIVLFLFCSRVWAQQPDSLIPVRGFCIAAPRPAELVRFLTFIDQELAPRKINTLILRVDFNYQFESHPELRDSIALAKPDVKRLVEICRKNNIRLIPQINLLGHQSWAGTLYNLLKVYPQFDETPGVKMPANYVWPNADSLYCKSYCPLHPEVHAVVFDLVDEICSVFETDAFHAGMDEVFYLADKNCPRCSGKDPARLFAGEVNRVAEHLGKKGRQLWIWGDRLLDGRQTGLGMWEASYNNTASAIDLVSKEIVICDWHYERPDKTAVYFAMKGFQVITCPWRNPEVGAQQMRDMIAFRNGSTPEMRQRFLGVMQTVWSGVTPFLDGFYGKMPDPTNGTNTPWHCFTRIFDRTGPVNP